MPSISCSSLFLFLFFFFNSEMVLFYDGGQIFTACKFHGHIASFKFVVHLICFIFLSFSSRLAVINHFKMHCLLGHAPHCLHVSRNKTLSFIICPGRYYWEHGGGTCTADSHADCLSVDPFRSVDTCHIGQLALRKYDFYIPPNWNGPKVHIGSQGTKFMMTSRAKCRCVNCIVSRIGRESL